MKIAVITSGFLPVPATSGGAVENLVDNFLKMNDKYKENIITVYSCYDKKAADYSKKYKNSKFIFIEFNFLIRFLDRVICLIAKYLLNKEKVMSYRYIIQRLYYLMKVSKDLKANNYDKIILENHPTLFLILKWNKNYIKYKDKFYYHLHNSIDNTYGCADIIRECKSNICVSQYIVNNLSSCLKVSSLESNFNILKNCIDEDRFKKKLSVFEKEGLLKKYNIGSDDKVILFTGRFTREKGIKELVLALKKVKYKNYKLLIVGSFFFDTEIKNNFELEIRNLIKDINSHVIFTGFIPYDEIYKIYYLADISVLPSIWDEPAGMTLIESMFCGLPIITTNSGGIPEYVNNKCAIILDRDDNLINNIAISIDYLLNNDKIMNEMGKYAKENSKKYTLENYYRQFIKILNKE